MMSKTTKKESVKVENNPEVVETPVVATPVSEKPKVVFPEVRGIGRFQMVQVEGGFAVYNPVGQRVTDVISDAKAKDIVLRQNNAGHYKG